MLKNLAFQGRESAIGTSQMLATQFLSASSSLISSDQIVDSLHTSNVLFQHSTLTSPELVSAAAKFLENQVWMNELRLQHRYERSFQTFLVVVSPYRVCWCTVQITTNFMVVLFKVVIGVSHEVSNTGSKSNNWWSGDICAFDADWPLIFCAGRKSFVTPRHPPIQLTKFPNRIT